MEEKGYAEWTRSFLREKNKRALIIDVRNNCGGFVSELILEKLLMPQMGFELPRWGTPTTLPSHAAFGPKVLLVDENTSSDGDIFAHSFRQVFIRFEVVGVARVGSLLSCCLVFRFCVVLLVVLLLARACLVTSRLVSSRHVSSRLFASSCLVTSRHVSSRLFASLVSPPCPLLYILSVVCLSILM
jgi:hypothetical protein